MLSISAEELAQLIQGKIEGDPAIRVNALAKIEEGIEGAVSFLSHPKYLQYIYDTQASIVILNKEFILEKPIQKKCTLIRVDDARATFSTLINFYAKQLFPEKKGIEQPIYAEGATISEAAYIGAFAYIGKGSIVGKNVKIYPNTYIGENVKIGENTVIYAGVKIYDYTQIGKNCVIQAGAVIGSDGFGFIPSEQSNYEKIIHIGNVIIEDYVEVGANATIDKATVGSTIIRKGVKLDNLIQIAHNTEVGENTVIAAQTGIAGSTKIGKNCMIGGQVGIIGHIKIEDEVKIAAQSGIGNDIKIKGAIVQGSPALPIGDYKKSYVLFKNLPSIKKELDQLKKDLLSSN